MAFIFDEIKKEIIMEKLSASDTKKSEINDCNGEIDQILLENLENMNANTVSTSYKEIPAEGFLKPIKYLVKKVIRRLVFWYVEPCVQQQNEYNMANTKFAAQVNSEINSINSINKNLNEQLIQLEQKSNENIYDINQKQENFSQNQERTMSKVEDLINKIEFMKLQLENTNTQLSSMETQYLELEKKFYSKLSELKYNGVKLDDAYLTEDDNVANLSFSQSGEDAIIRYIFSATGRKPSECKYLDLGANHAKYLSNTYSFYMDGARGVLVDANPKMTKELEAVRPEDIVLNRCISNRTDDKLDFYILSGDGLSTMDIESVKHCIQENPNIRIEQTISVESITIDQIIEQYFKDTTPDILNVDIEGMEMEVLNMIDFTKFRPFIIICEMIEYKSVLTIGEKSQEILDFMHEHEYEEFAFTGINSIFVDKNALGGND